MTHRNLRNVNIHEKLVPLIMRWEVIFIFLIGLFSRIFLQGAYIPFVIRDHNVNYSKCTRTRYMVDTSLAPPSLCGLLLVLILWHPSRNFFCMSPSSPWWGSLHASNLRGSQSQSVSPVLRPLPHKCAGFPSCEAQLLQGAHLREIWTLKEGCKSAKQNALCFL